MDEAKAAYEKAVDHFIVGDLVAAERAFKEIVERHPDYADAYESIGMICYRTGRLDEAIEWMTRLSAMRPDYAMAHTNLSVFYMKKGMKEKAEEEKAKATVLSFGKPGTR